MLTERTHLNCGKILNTENELPEDNIDSQIRGYLCVMRELRETLNSLGHLLCLIISTTPVITTVTNGKVTLEAGYF